METIKEASKTANDYTTPNNYNAFNDGFECGVEFAQRWIDVNDKLPAKGIEVFLKVEKISWITTNHTVGYLKENTMNIVWMIESRHCSHYKNAANNYVTQWRPIERL